MIIPRRYYISYSFKLSLDWYYLFSILLFIILISDLLKLLTSFLILTYLVLDLLDNIDFIDYNDTLFLLLFAS